MKLAHPQPADDAPSGPCRLPGLIELIGLIGLIGLIESQARSSARDSTARGAPEMPA